MEYQPDSHISYHQGGTISGVTPGSIADDLELQPGDIVLAINDRPVRDIIDYRFAIASEQIELLVRGSTRSIIYEIEKSADEDLGLAFVDPLFDPLRICKNKCPFCFLAQMPRGMRKSLYLKDDDFRLSFLYGNFVTLTNLTSDDWQRIEEQRLSPLHISVHATDHMLRSVLLGKPDIPDVLAQIRRLGNAGISVHTQVVLCPGLNDGPALHQTVQALAALYPVVQSIAVVPIGLTQYRSQRSSHRNGQAATPTLPQAKPECDSAVAATDWGFCARLTTATALPLRCYTPDEAAQILDMLLPYSQRYQRDHGRHLVYPADEFYLMCGRNVPPASFYDGYPQYSNGVGMTRELLNTWQRVKRRLPSKVSSGNTRVALVCGTLIAPTLQPIVAQINRTTGMHMQVLPIANAFFGETVTVSGLLVGHDVIAALQTSHATTALLPRVMFDYEGLRTLDDYSPHHIADEAGMPVQVLDNLEDLVGFVIARASASCPTEHAHSCT